MGWKTLVLAGLTAATRTGAGRRVVRSASRAGVLPWRATGTIPITGQFRVHVGAGFTYRSVAEDWIGQNLFWAGLGKWEHETFPDFIRLARGARTFLDVGANTGAYTLVATAVNPSLKAWAFEPVPEMLERLRDHVRLNRLEDRVAVVSQPASDIAGPVQFHVAASADQSKIVQAGDVVGVTMTAVRIDDEITEPVDLVKLDVEGAEPQVLRGMRRILQQDRPHIVVELLCEQTAQAVLAELPDHYTLWHMSFGGLRPHDTVVPGRKDRNYLCVPGPA